MRRGIPLVVLCALSPLQILSCTRSKTGPVSPSSLSWKLQLDNSFPAPWEHPTTSITSTISPHLLVMLVMTSHKHHQCPCVRHQVSPPNPHGLFLSLRKGISLPNVARCCQIHAACYLSPFILEVIGCFSVSLPPTKLLGDTSKIVSANSSST